MLDIECLDRIYLNAYVADPAVQRAGGRVHDPAPGQADPVAGADGADRDAVPQGGGVLRVSSNGIPWVKFGKDDRKIDVMQPHLQAQAATGRSGVAAVGVSQEFQRVWSAYQRDTQTAAPQYTFAKADRRVTCYYFYLWDEDFGRAFIKVCAYFPYPAKIWVNGHEWAKRQALKAGIGFTELSNGFASCDDPAGLQEICDRLQPGTIEVFAQRWLHRHPDALRQQGPRRRVLVGVLDAAGRGLPHHRLRRPAPRPVVLRGADRRQPGPGPPGERGDHLRPAGPLRHPRDLPHRHRPPASSTRTTRAWW